MHSWRQRAAAGFLFVVRLILGAVLLWAALGKIREPYDFLSSVYDYALVGPDLGMLVAMVLPWLELLLGICLLGGLFVGGALLSSAALGVVFVFVQASAMSRGLDIACGCFSGLTSVASQETISYATILRAGLMLAAALLGYVAWLSISSGGWRSSSPSAEPTPAPSPAA